MDPVGHCWAHGRRPHPVEALLAAPVTEPASVAELREAIRGERGEAGSAQRHMDAARARVDSILARLDVTGPVVRCAACPIQAQRWRAVRARRRGLRGLRRADVTGPAQRGEADEESAARGGHHRGGWRGPVAPSTPGPVGRAVQARRPLRELDAAIDATSWEAIRAKNGAGREQASRRHRRKNADVCRGCGGLLMYIDTGSIPDGGSYECRACGRGTRSPSPTTRSTSA